jgi:hypothetical protein
VPQRDELDSHARTVCRRTDRHGQDLVEFARSRHADDVPDVRLDPLATSNPPLPAALRDVVLRPDTFFRRLAPSGSLGRPTFFALGCIAVSTVLAWLATGADDAVGSGLGVPFVFDLVFFVAYVAITHAAVLMLAKGRHSGPAATYRVAAYSQVSQLINWIPSVGLAIGFLYGSVLAVIGIRRLHDTSLRTAVAVVVLPVVVAAVVAGAVLAVMAAT